MKKMRKKIKKEVNMICSMSDTEMKLIVSVLKEKIVEKEIRGIVNIIDLTSLMKKITVMIERQTPYV
jgi:hypothetical protein